MHPTISSPRRPPTSPGAVRVAATADLHYVAGDDARLERQLGVLRGRADVLLVAGDLTDRGAPAEAAGVASVLQSIDLPVAVVLGNHDIHLGFADEIAGILTERGVAVLQGGAVSIRVGPFELGVAGVTGFGGGFADGGTDAFAAGLMAEMGQRAREEAARLEAALRSLDTDLRIALLHYAPCRDTVRGERPDLHPFLGSHLIGWAVDRAGADLVLHGHAHFGREQGTTAGGIPVRNVALPVTRGRVRVLDLEPAAATVRGRRPADVPS